jgi:hypothetical protein
VRKSSSSLEAVLQTEHHLWLKSLWLAVVLSSWRAQGPSVTCCSCSVLHASLFTSRFTKQTWERGQRQSIKWKTISPFSRK